jgi:hypothetical protein
MLGSARNARAMVISCFSPALTPPPSSSMTVWYPSGSVRTKRSTCAATAAARTCSCVGRSVLRLRSQPYLTSAIREVAPLMLARHPDPGDSSAIPLAHRDPANHPGTGRVTCDRAGALCPGRLVAIVIRHSLDQPEPTTDVSDGQPAKRTAPGPDTHRPMGAGRSSRIPVSFPKDEVRGQTKAIPSPLSGVRSTSSVGVYARGDARLPSYAGPAGPYWGSTIPPACWPFRMGASNRH